MGVESVGFTDDGHIFLTIIVKDGDREGRVVSKMTTERAKEVVEWIKTALKQVPVGGEVVIENERNRANLN